MSSPTTCRDTSHRKAGATCSGRQPTGLPELRHRRRPTNLLSNPSTPTPRTPPTATAAEGGSVTMRVRPVPVGYLAEVHGAGSDRASRRRDLSPEPGSPGQARAVIRSACLAWGIDDGVGEDAELVATELVANVVDHAGTPMHTRRQPDRRRPADRGAGLLPLSAAAASAGRPEHPTRARTARDGRGVLPLGRDPIPRRQVRVGPVAAESGRRCCTSAEPGPRPPRPRCGIGVPGTARRCDHRRRPRPGCGAPQSPAAEAAAVFRDARVGRSAIGADSAPGSASTRDRECRPCVACSLRSTTSGPHLAPN